LRCRSSVRPDQSSSRWAWPGQWEKENHGGYDRSALSRRAPIAALAAPRWATPRPQRRVGEVFLAGRRGNRDSHGFRLPSVIMNRRVRHSAEDDCRNKSNLPAPSASEAMQALLPGSSWIAEMAGTDSGAASLLRHYGFQRRQAIRQIAWKRRLSGEMPAAITTTDAAGYIG